MGSDNDSGKKDRSPNGPILATVLDLLLLLLLLLLLTTSTPPPDQGQHSEMAQEMAQLRATKTQLAHDITRLEQDTAATYASFRSPASDRTVADRTVALQAENDKLLELVEEQKGLEGLLRETKWQAEENERVAKEHNDLKTPVPPAPVVPAAPAVVSATPAVVPASSPTSYQTTISPSTPNNPLLTPSPTIVHFPCPLRDVSPAHACTLTCRDATCTRAVPTCEAYVECTHLVYSKETSDDLTGATVTLMHERKSTDGGEMEAKFRELVGKGKIGEDVRPRTYVIVSYGGSGSKMLSGWISDQVR